MDGVIADLHLHSRYSRAVSQEMVPATIAAWARKKGINLVGTGDFTHPLWIKQLESELVEAGDGIYRLRGPGMGDLPKFVLTTELSCVYSEGGKTRRIHVVVILPSFAGVAKLNSELSGRGVNLLSDGRPVMGLSLKTLSEILLTIEPKALIIPAHVWTPWFGVYGANGGYDSLVEAFGQWAKNVPAVETGMSSDPAMNWRVAELDDKQIVSFGDAHSPIKLGREATVFRRKMPNAKDQIPNFNDVYDAIWGREEGDWEIGYTIEFYPEEGKYHYTGHRNCKVCQSPEETKILGSTCPVCGRALTIGVAHRVEKLAGRGSSLSESLNKEGVRFIENKERPQRPGYVMLVPLIEVVAEALDSGVASQKVMGAYENLCADFGGEFEVLLTAPVGEIARVAGERAGEGVAKVRKGEIRVDPGYDGVFGKVKIWEEAGEMKANTEQQTLF